MAYISDIDRLPDCLLLEIMTYLNFPTLCTVAEVSRKFYRLSQDKRFWKRLDCSTFKTMGINGLYRIIRRPSAVHVVSIRWEGYIRRLPSFCRGSNRIRTRQAVTEPFLTEVAQRCPNLREMHIIYADLNSITLRDFPANLEFLGFEGSIFTFDFFAPLADPDFLPNLKGLDLNYCHGLSSNSRFSIPGILSRQQLTTLLLKHCFKVSEEHLIEIPARLANLHTLNVSELPNVNAGFIEVLAQAAASLKILDLSFYSGITTNTIRPLATSKVCLLQKLYLIETNIDDDALALFAEHQPELRYLNVVKTRCTANGIVAFNRVNPYCQVEHKSSEVGEKIGGSFWWIKISYGDDDQMEQ